ncbi:MAG: GIY-YIG nuclease family protein [Nitrospirae bacterium]|nr:GIY-YIG nuclease family protein [Nitrospirota bacterium]
MKTYYVYIITNKWNTTLYIGVTNDLGRRMYEHKQGLVEGFSKKYNLRKLLYFEETDDVQAAIEREKQLKKWRRDKKIVLIKKVNPQFEDLSTEWFR